MANIISMAKQTQVITLHQAGWSRRKIAKHLNINRRTVSKYITEHSLKPKGNGAESKCTIPTAGSDSSTESKCTIPTTGSDSVQPSQTGRKSYCEPYRNIIASGIEKGQSADLSQQTLFGAI